MGKNSSQAQLKNPSPPQVDRRKIEGFQFYVENQQKAKCEDAIEEVIKNAKKIWRIFYDENKSNPNKAEEGVELLEKTLEPLVVYGFILIKHECDELLAFLIEKLGALTIGESLSGYTSILSTPFASLHNLYYYFGAFALKKGRTGSLAVLVNTKIPVDYDYKYENVWERGKIFILKEIWGEDAMFNRLLDTYDKVALIHENFEKEEFISLVCQFNFILCFKVIIKDEQTQKGRWFYANFGRMSGHRVMPLIHRLEIADKYSEDFNQRVFGESWSEFKSKFWERLAQIKQEQFGRQYIWESIPNDYEKELERIFGEELGWVFQG